ncbi:holin [Amycolatopsis echigonensis]|uniref:Holin n=1 Tax=Amycolatopsis echigonensis TaxID=2576905 RepID=A0A8E1W5L3_9PSEU|nr:holin [Amycolatopsis echigonensis]MBB2504306.1 holin [Amycolatopsis echigonensis]
MPRAGKVCTGTRGVRCTEVVPAGTRCPACTRRAEEQRGSARARGYDHRHETRFRRAVLELHPICQLCGRDVAVHADHHPVDRRTLVLRGEDPNDPRHGRGLCASCHSAETAKAQPGGWNRR